MTTVQQTIALASGRHFGRRVPPCAMGELLRELQPAVRQSIRMAYQGRSQARGKRPDWLEAAADIRFIGHDGTDETRLYFEAPQLGSAAPRLYEQGELWPTRPDAADTGFDLLCDVLADVAAGNPDSERFDRPLLNQLGHFRRALIEFPRVAVSSRRYPESRPALLTPAVLDTAQTFRTNTPPPRRVRLVGRLDMLRASTQTFELILDDGQAVRGVLTAGDIGTAAPLFKQRVLVLGKVIYRPSGRLLRVDADALTTAPEGSHFFSQVPTPIGQRFNLAGVVRQQQHKQGLAAIFGKWPGDETDEEIQKALKGLD